jgi:hypothetical protein
MHGLIDHFLHNFPYIVAFWDANGPSTMQTLGSIIPQADNAFTRFFNRD